MPVLLNGVQATGPSDTPNVGDGKSICIHVCSASTSTATVKIQQSMGGGFWKTVATITNPSSEGEIWRGPSLPLTRVYVSSYTAGAIYAFYDFPSGAEASTWAKIDSTVASTTANGFIVWSWTNAQVVAAGTGGTSANLYVGQLPANSRPAAIYLINDTQATFAAGTLTASVGVAGTAYTDWLAASNLKATAATLYGNAAAEKGSEFGSLYYTTAKDIYCQFVAGAGDLANVTTCTGTVRIEYVTYPS